MSNDSLNELLARADNAALPPTVSGDLAARVRQRAKRQSRRRVVLSSFATIAGCAVLALMLFSPPTPASRQSTPAQLAQIRAELADLDSAATAHHRAAQALQRIEARAQQLIDEEPYPATPTPLQRVDEARDRAALILVREAERAALQTGQESTANESYQRAARLFPETPAGRVAAGRLKPLGTSTEMRNWRLAERASMQMALSRHPESL